MLHQLYYCQAEHILPGMGALSDHYSYFAWVSSEFPLNVLSSQLWQNFPWESGSRELVILDLLNK
jgi:hypothetical protein